MSRLAIMQPYFLPYIGYFQLLAAVDKFVVFDDVNFIRSGWINRNRMLCNGKALTFTIPLSGASQNRRICDISLADGPWRKSLLRTIAQAYAKAPYFRARYALIEYIVQVQSPSIAAYALQSLHQIARYLGIATDIIDSAQVYGNAALKGEDRIIDICRCEQASKYVNAAGGVDLYHPAAFAQHDISLHFLRTQAICYPQRGNEYVAHLSILDVLMFNDIASIQTMLQQYALFHSENDTFDGDRSYE